MRHRKDGRRLGRNTGQRKALVRSLATNLLVQERITTTTAKAKEARRVVDQLVTLGKANTLVARRRAFEILGDRTVVRKLFTEIAPRMTGHTGGYTRLIRLRRRPGDNAELVLLELSQLAAPLVPEASTARGQEAAGDSAKGRRSRRRRTTGDAQAADEPKAVADSKSKGASKDSEASKSTQQPPSDDQGSSADSSKKGFIDGVRKFFKK